MTVQTVPVQLARVAFTIEQFQRMGQSGIFAPEQRLELIHGEILEMSPIGIRHAAAVDRLTALFSSVNRQCIVRGQNPIQLSGTSLPQPDVTLLRRRDDFYEKAYPEPADVLLVVEVADTSLAYDRDVKVPLYAQAGIPEVWIMDLNKRELAVYRFPANGKYTEVRYPQPADTVAPVLLPEASYFVEQVVGQA
ncbi:MAG: Uma2 family endonuclease [Cytophagales bacterium]|nr:Uma2 family endonuclease [Cytophagales bacterium]